jgi:hypothetical protein
MVGGANLTPPATNIRTESYATHVIGKGVTRAVEIWKQLQGNLSRQKLLYK